MSQQGPRELFDRFQRNALAGEPALDEGMCAEDIVVESPFAPSGHRRVEGRANVLAMTREGRAALPVTFEEFRNVVVHETADPEVIVAEYEMVASVPGKSGPEESAPEKSVPGDARRASASFVVVLRARDGRVVHWREYQDRAAIMEALAP
ncbi:nuclear transport factor 2 family protein [Actinomadura terrae]|uniref:nuclear transport factor 2 family protein n=1 Tax=Actinomadura terrae TaxID=604353 RepID=UPI001FA7FB7A|nr:nuclear transport factor 2 family protein [Actinomadura terrae]